MSSMAKSIPALITPEVLVWARKLDAISIDEIAAKMKVQPQKIEEWESGTSYPTLSQAKDLAKQYRVPFVYFYFQTLHKEQKDSTRWTTVLLETVAFRTLNPVN